MLLPKKGYHNGPEQMQVYGIVKIYLDDILGRDASECPRKFLHLNKKNVF